MLIATSSQENESKPQNVDFGHKSKILKPDVQRELNIVKSCNALKVTISKCSVIGCTQVDLHVQWALIKFANLNHRDK